MQIQTIDGYWDENSLGWEVFIIPPTDNEVIPEEIIGHWLSDDLDKLRLLACDRNIQVIDCDTGRPI